MLETIDYVFLLKLIRGVLVAQKKPHLDVVNWLKKSFRWRPVGYGKKTSSVLKSLGLKSRLYLELVLPSEKLKFFGEILSKEFHENTAEGILLSLVYVVPLIILDSETSSEIINSDATIINIQTTKKMNTRFIKLHLRIAEYSTKDLFKKTIKDTKKKLLTANTTESILKYRKQILKKDSKRFWRINQGTGKIVISYIDPLRIALQKNRDILVENVEKNPLSELLLGHVVAIHLSEILKNE